MLPIQSTGSPVAGFRVSAKAWTLGSAWGQGTVTRRHPPEWMRKMPLPSEPAQRTDPSGPPGVNARQRMKSDWRPLRVPRTSHWSPVIWAMPPPDVPTHMEPSAPARRARTLVLPMRSFMGRASIRPPRHRYRPPFSVPIQTVREPLGSVDSARARTSGSARDPLASKGRQRPRSRIQTPRAEPTHRAPSLSRRQKVLSSASSPPRRCQAPSW